MTIFTIYGQNKQGVGKYTINPKADFEAKLYGGIQSYIIISYIVEAITAPDFTFLDVTNACRQLQSISAILHIV